MILTKCPDLESIKDLGSFFQSPWGKSFIPLLGGTRSLDDIEHGLIRGSGRYKDPRVHFAANCASIGCPSLRAEAYVGDRLDEQLEDAARSFLRDRSRNRLDEGELKVSSIFKWYRNDFEKGWRGKHSLAQFLAGYADSLIFMAAVRPALFALGSRKWRLRLPETRGCTAAAGTTTAGQTVRSPPGSNSIAPLRTIQFGSRGSTVTLPGSIQMLWAGLASVARQAI